MSVQEEFEPDFDARWAFEEHMHILEEAELDWYEANNRDIEEYEDYLPAETILQHTTDWEEE